MSQSKRLPRCKSRKLISDEIALYEDEAYAEAIDLDNVYDRIWANALDAVWRHQVEWCCCEEPMCSTEMVARRWFAMYELATQHHGVD